MMRLHFDVGRSESSPMYCTCPPPSSVLQGVVKAARPFWTGQDDVKEHGKWERGKTREKFVWCTSWQRHDLDIWGCDIGAALVVISDMSWKHLASDRWDSVNFDVWIRQKSHVPVNEVM